ncbi:hypothetical protein [Streptomyces acidiscabies]|uniref:hypothetical protein n=1 Tax=Streptomyces acidiscabies TaxID=42234 RepID=UPI000A9324BF|nr:hypothetical protein [Streptomyces acidiscabies]
MVEQRRSLEQQLCGAAAAPPGGADDASNGVAATRAVISCSPSVTMKHPVELKTAVGEFVD